ncbi:unnamed protein product [Didymodactylos carnosus]|uniref:Uncharacterized protein n=1 Tax=Didymodactylos carnosus TaxID=1234261 RepID=A0A814JV70_9BILA|nr:unnamed protein product [Didymodactylos carnosus]CAF1073556.1 unnamed protein product [Didymodactylos carnosus]CAF3813051.1 unnamed protein product [Didymodactylos carnosus]CAF3837578.1 unnamed protein product [Didymodactylos carnosus]
MVMFQQSYELNCYGCGYAYCTPTSSSGYTVCKTLISRSTTASIAGCVSYSSIVAVLGDTSAGNCGTTTTTTYTGYTVYLTYGCCYTTNCNTCPSTGCMLTQSNTTCENNAVALNSLVIYAILLELFILYIIFYAFS